MSGARKLYLMIWVLLIRDYRIWDYLVGEKFAAPERYQVNKLYGYVGASSRPSSSSSRLRSARLSQTLVGRRQLINKSNCPGCSPFKIRLGDILKIWLLEYLFRESAAHCKVQVFEEEAKPMKQVSTKWKNN